MSASEPNLTDRFAGSLLMAVGGMIFLTCGWCTLSVIGAGVASLAPPPHASAPDRYSDGWNVLGLFLAPAIGGVPTVVGFAVAALGLAVFRDRRTPRGDRRLGGVVLMVSGAAVAWPCGGMLFALVAEIAKRFSPEEWTMVDLVIGVGAAVVGLLSLAVFRQGWRMALAREDKPPRRARPPSPHP